MDRCVVDVAIIGGGIVGLATAWRLLERSPRTTVLVLEKETEVAQHQTGRNSGVLHSGVYYKPGSHKALTCRAGKAMMEAFCREQGVPHEICGKTIVATSQRELPALERIYERGLANGVACEKIDAARLRELEPHARGVAGLHVREAGIVNYRQVAQRLTELVRQQGSEVRTGEPVVRIAGDSDVLRLVTSGGETRARFLVNCAGLQADRIARLAGERPRLRIVPFRGEYYLLRPEARHLCRNLIYPVPDPRFPFLGVHFTRMIGRDKHGPRVECGPNAVLAMKREGYGRASFRVADFASVMSYPGTWKMAAGHWRTGAGEIWRSLSKGAFARALQRLVPEIRPEHLERGPAGVRAQALAPDGTLVDDFAFLESERALHVLNAPSPAATAALAIGDRIVDRLQARGVYEAG